MVIVVAMCEEKKLLLLSKKPNPKFILKIMKITEGYKNMNYDHHHDNDHNDNEWFTRISSIRSKKKKNQEKKSRQKNFNDDNNGQQHVSNFFSCLPFSLYSESIIHTI